MVSKKTGRRSNHNSTLETFAEKAKKEGLDITKIDVKITNEPTWFTEALDAIEESEQNDKQ